MGEGTPAYRWRITRADFRLAESAGLARTGTRYNPYSRVRVASAGAPRWECVAFAVNPRSVTLAFNNCDEHPGFGTVMEVCENCESWRDDTSTRGPDCYQECRQRGFAR